MQRAHLFVTGRVQGVWYRVSTREQACSLGLTGWVRNLRDGRVEILAEGSREDLDALVRWAHEGPAAAQVADVAVSWAEASAEFGDFEVAATA